MSPLKVYIMGLEENARSGGLISSCTIEDFVNYDVDQCGKICSWMQEWHECYKGHLLLSYWIQGLIHRKKCMPGTVNLAKKQ